MSIKTLLVTPPFTQLNTPYPATAYLKGFFDAKGFGSLPKKSAKTSNSPLDFVRTVEFSVPESLTLDPNHCENDSNRC